MLLTSDSGLRIRGDWLICHVDKRELAQCIQLKPKILERVEDPVAANSLHDIVFWAGQHSPVRIMGLAHSITGPTDYFNNVAAVVDRMVNAELCVRRHPRAVDRL